MYDLTASLGFRCRHYFSVLIPGEKKNTVLIEELMYDSYGHPLEHSYTDQANLIVGEMGSYVIKAYLAEWDSTHLLQADYIDATGKNCYRDYYSCGKWKDGYYSENFYVLMDTVVNDIDTARATGYWNNGKYILLKIDPKRGGAVIPPDTLHVITCYYDANGLLNSQKELSYIDYYYGKVPIYREAPQEFMEKYEYDYY